MGVWRDVWAMLKLDTVYLFAPLTFLASAHQRLVVITSLSEEARQRGERYVGLIDRERITQIGLSADQIERAAAELSLPAAERLASSVKEACAVAYEKAPQIDDRTTQTLELLIRELVGAVSAEMDARVLLALLGDEARTFEPTEPLFGERVDRLLPDAAFDIEEAGKCLALDRYTACVFHLMRAVEVGLRAACDSLNATIVNRHGEGLGWGMLTANLDKAISAMPKGEERDAWQKIPALLHSVNRAWRTKTAHPKATYTKEEADVVWRISQDCLEELALRL